jgi:hypothetical protein
LARRWRAEDVLRAAVARGNVARVIGRRADRNRPTLSPALDRGCRAALASARTTSQELTTATASISIIKSGPARRVTPTVVLVGVATPR